jgi:DNA mismatch repair protein MutS
MKITPMLKQYLSIKEQYPDAILFYRMGDFYEMFFEDATVASKILEITLTSRNKNDNQAVPMCGVPFRAAKGYVARLIETGHKVAICDQMEDPALSKGLVKREVVRIITPGMIVEDEYLDGKTNNFIVSAVRQGDVLGISCLDISTGTFRLTQSVDVEAVVDEIQRISPNEMLFPEAAKSDSFFMTLVSMFEDKAIGYLDNGVFEYGKGREKLMRHFQTLSLEGFGCENFKAGVGAAGALIHYVGETQKQRLSHIAGIETYSLDQFLLVDETSCKNLELIRNLRTGTRQGTLFNVIDHTVTAMGARRLKNWLQYPLIDGKRIESRLDAVAEGVEKIFTAKEIRLDLSSVYDLQRISSKVALGHCNARDLVALKQSLKMLPSIRTRIETFTAPLFNRQTDIRPLTDLADLIERSIREDAPPVINEGGVIKSGFNEALDELLEISTNAKGFLAKLETEQKEATGINSLKVRYNKVFGYYIEIPRAHADSVPETYIRKQTLVNAERYITEELKVFETKALSAQEKRASLEYEIFHEIRGQVILNHALIQEIADYLAEVDCLLSLAQAADENNYCRPQIKTDGRIMIADGRHPVVEKMIAGERFVPNSITLDNEKNQVMIITGPNMAGKSTILRQTALTVLLAQMGSFVPAAKASVSIIDRIFTRVGALDNLSGGQSTFMVEMQETANILHNATPNSLVIMDEIGRGTGTFDGLSIAWAVAEYLHDLHHRGVKTLFATHYHKLTDLSRYNKRVKNYHVAVKEWNEEIIFLRKLAEGGTNRSYGIQVARLAGLPEKVIGRAKKILFHVENGEAAIGGLSSLEEDKAAFKKGHVQLSLFNNQVKNQENYILETLRRLDVSTLTPIDAMNWLHDLAERSKTS